MFKPKTKTVAVEGQEVTLRQLTVGETNEMDEGADMAVVVALSWVSPDSVTAEQVRGWPLTVVSQLYEACVELNGLDAGN
jgi:hypothetical protein